MALSGAALWAVIGLVLLIAEIFTVSFFVLFFGVAALVVAALKAGLGLDHLAVELILFGALGGAGLFVFRDKLLRNFGRKSAGVAIDRNQTITLSAPLAPRGDGKIEYQGSPWDAHNDSDEPLAAGARVVVHSTQGIKLIVRPAAGQQRGEGLQ